jgi:1,4-alpha-glucan branching enzyme
MRENEITEEDRWLMAAGRHRGLHELLGCHLDETGAIFRLWAPGAAWASVVGSFNNWKGTAHPLSSLGNGFWIANGNSPLISQFRFTRFTSARGETTGRCPIAMLPSRWPNM